MFVKELRIEFLLYVCIATQITTTWCLALLCFLSKNLSFALNPKLKHTLRWQPGEIQMLPWYMFWYLHFFSFSSVVHNIQPPHSSWETHNETCKFEELTNSNSDACRASVCFKSSTRCDTSTGRSCSFFSNRLSHLVMCTFWYNFNHHCELSHMLSILVINRIFQKHLINQICAWLSGDVDVVML